ncbi:MAG: transglycosylase domain-containing protein [Chitinivibrionales bacterium]|nr:transglycosylase domain-containing protein [Chitinivibrionales bacterium]
MVLLCVFIISLVGGMIGWYVLRIYQGLPDPAALKNIEPALMSRVLAQDGTLLHEFSIERRSWIALDKVPSPLIDAVIAIEDRRFYMHHGVDFQRILGAALIDVVHRGYAQGASTITQQLARNVYLTFKPSITRKVREILTAWQLEGAYSKKEILELYLNQVYLGAGVYGIQAASLQFFSKPAATLSLNECAMLAGMIQSPENYRPDKSGNIKRITMRRNTVLKAMVNSHALDKKTCEAIQNLPISSHPFKHVSRRAPYFVEMVRQYVEQRYGDEMLYNGGLRSIPRSTRPARIRPRPARGCNLRPCSGALIFISSTAPACIPSCVSRGITFSTITTRSTRPIAPNSIRCPIRSRFALCKRPWWRSTFPRAPCLP